MKVKIRLNIKKLLPQIEKVSEVDNPVKIIKKSFLILTFKR